MSKQFISITKHNAYGGQDIEVRKTYEKAVDDVHECFLSYDFEVRDGKPYDPGHEDKKDLNAAFECFSEVIMHNGKVAQFTHCDGEGPSGEIIIKNKKK